MVRANQDIRAAAKEKGVPLYRLAKKVGLNDGNLSRKLRYELPESEKKRYLAAIDAAAEEMKSEGK